MHSKNLARYTMTKREQYEIFLIITFVFAASIFSLYLPDQIRLGRIVLYCASLLLFQGLLRDLSMYFFNPKKIAKSQQTTVTAQCLCLESGIGIIGIMTGLLLFFYMNDSVVFIAPWLWIGLLTSILIAGYLMKDWVFYWQTFEFKREQNHANIIFTFKTKFNHENNKY